jgi:hypothetical protein
MLFDAISPTDVQVHMNYGQADVCGVGGPFAWIRSNARQIAPIIDPDELILLMTPPLKFRERKGLFISVAVFMVIFLAATISFVLYLNSHPDLNT